MQFTPSLNQAKIVPCLSSIMGFSRLRENFQCYSQNWVPQTQPYFFFFQSCPWCQASGLCSVLFSEPGIYVETYVYDDVYIRLPMTSYLRQMSHHVRQPYIGSSKSDFSFRQNFTKKYFFSKVRLITDSARSDLSKEPIKVGTRVKIRKKNKVFRDNWS